MQVARTANVRESVTRNASITPIPASNRSSDGDVLRSKRNATLSLAMHGRLPIDRHSGHDDVAFARASNQRVAIQWDDIPPDVAVPSMRLPFIVP